MKSQMIALSASGPLPIGRFWEVEKTLNERKRKEKERKKKKKNLKREKEKRNKKEKLKKRKRNDRILRVASFGNFSLSSIRQRRE